MPDTFDEAVARLPTSCQRLEPFHQHSQPWKFPQSSLLSFVDECASLRIHGNFISSNLLNREKIEQYTFPVFSIQIQLLRKTSEKPHQ